ncbi:hypothetical protein [Streptomyces sp. NPDC048825]|uniref:hypothetical protein n=1 Tax=Streptomyces sp. NPDC048825 TaxID=3365592 RepID=UPI0037183F4F
MLLIAHRLSTVTSADQLILCDGGRVHDHGPHPELLERNDLYRELAATQLAGLPYQF